ncbi:hypothetical protein JN06_00489 [Bacteroides zoogleoformans]|nr:hypothetical protein JN06_00489 [Bacteroides zoogleoformans]
MEFNFNKYSFRSILYLCRKYHRECLMPLDRDSLKAVLDNRRVRFKKLAEVVCHTKYFRNFVLGDHSDFCLYFFVL